MKTTLEGASVTLKQGPPGSTQKKRFGSFTTVDYFLLLLGETCLVSYVGEFKIYHFQKSRYNSLLME